MTGLKPAKRVSYTFDMGDAGDMDPHYLRKTAMAEHQGAVPFDRMNIMQQREIFHEMQFQKLKAIWIGRLAAIGNLQLQRLETWIDVEECYCPVGCCRLVETVFGLLGPFQQQAPWKVEVVGWKNEWEKDQILALMVSRGGMKQDTMSLVRKAKGELGDVISRERTGVSDR
jgi:hypothetical protein